MPSAAMPGRDAVKIVVVPAAGVGVATGLGVVLSLPPQAESPTVNAAAQARRGRRGNRTGTSLSLRGEREGGR
jgi:hypothetical protein